MEIRYQLQHADMLASQRHLQARMRAQRAGLARRIAGGLIGGLAGYFATMLLLNQLINGYESWMWGLTSLLLIVSVVWTIIWRRSGRYEQWMEQFAGDYVLNLTPAGISASAPGTRVGFHTWPEILALETTDTGLYFYLRRDAAFIVPRTAFADDAAADDFAGAVHRLWAAHPVNAGKALPDTPARRSFFPAKEIGENLRAAVQVLFFLEFNPLDFRVSRSMLAWLLLAQLLWYMAADYVVALPAPEFNSLGLSAFGANILLTLAGAAFISSILMQRASMLRLLVMVVSTSLVIDLIYLPVYTMVELLPFSAHKLLWVLYAGAVLWGLMAVFRIVRCYYRLPRPSALLMVSFYAFFALALDGLLPPQDLYINAEPDGEEIVAPAESAEPVEPVPPAESIEPIEPIAPVAPGRIKIKLNAEEIFYRQPGLVEQAVAGLKPHHPGKPNLYFVGFAGQSDEKVFSNEINYARDLLDRRFDTAGHSLLLLNNTDTVKDTPIANARNLEAVLQGIAKRMNKQEDVLFLYLSSHGAKDHRLSVSFEPMELDDLKAEKLKAMLDKSGIRNRVIVVSACYSGGFLDVLKDDNTLVLTASSRDHVAYGCGDATEYTFFGEAYFVNSLENDNSFITAFDEARKIIEAREKKEGMDASRPQIHVGRNIKKVLDKLKVFPPSDKTYSCGEFCPGESG